MKKINLKNINFFLIIRYLYPITIVVIIITLLILLKFLYNNVYQTIIQAELITDLRKEVTDENLAKDKFDQVLQKIELKSSSNTADISVIKDPFQNLTAPVVPKP